MQQVQDTITAQRVRTKLPEADAGYKIFNKKEADCRNVVLIP